MTGRHCLGRRRALPRLCLPLRPQPLELLPEAVVPLRLPVLRRRVQLQVLRLVLRPLRRPHHRAAPLVPGRTFHYRLD